MATVVLQVVGAAIGGAIGGPVGATIGRAVGAAAGYALDQKIFSKDQTITGPRLDGSRFLSSNDGASIPRVYGRVQIGGQIIWATRFEELRSQSTQGGKGGPKTRVTQYSYFGNFAVGLCAGPISHIGRIWADGTELDLTGINFRIHNGAEDQLPDPMIEALQSSGNTPAYRGLAYVVFEDFALEQFGNRIPQLTFEVIRAIGDLENSIKSICIIPGATAFGYNPTKLQSADGNGGTHTFNRHIAVAESDWSASLDELQALCPNLESVSLIVSWFGNDLRAEYCNVKPGVERNDINADGHPWQVSGTGPVQAHQISIINETPSFGSTPSDKSVIAAIKDLKQRGLKVTFYPFIMMDIEPNNSLPDPNGQSFQPAYPWRGQITCNPAIGQASTADQTATANAQVSTFAGDALAAQFTSNVDTVQYTGTPQWSYRRFILHYAHLCVLAGGVDGFIIGSELRGLTSIRDDTNAFPFVGELQLLAADTKSILGVTVKVSYAADWSEYFGYHPEDGSNDLYFNLDSLWASTDIDAIGIDNYMPLSDWRSDGDPEQPGADEYDRSYFAGNIAGGEGFDWYYQSQTDRIAATRTPITDGQGEPWVWRYKDLKSWWLNAHHERVAGVRSPISTSWQPQSKPFWFTEVGCPAINKGANQPNVFFDEKSSQSAIPHFSNAHRDDVIQRNFLQAHMAHWSQNEQLENVNPSSNVYSGRMVDAANISLWAWDARPFPAFPMHQHIGTDRTNWSTGHWLNGRLGGCRLDDLIEQILADYGFDDFEINTAAGCVDGFTIPNPAPARQALEPLLSLFGTTAISSAGKIGFIPVTSNSKTQLDTNILVENSNEPTSTINRAQNTDLPVQAVIHHDEIAGNIQSVASKSRRLEIDGKRQIQMQLPAVLPSHFARHLADINIRHTWIGRETLQVNLPPQSLQYSPGDILEIAPQPYHGTWQIVAIEDGHDRRLNLRRREAPASLSYPPTLPVGASEVDTGFGKPLVLSLDIPFTVTSTNHTPKLHFAVAANPWAGNYSYLSSPLLDGFEIRQNSSNRATIAKLIEPLEPGPQSRWDHANVLKLQIINGSFESKSTLLVLNGANAIAVQSDDGSWELIQFEGAVLNPDGSWSLSGLLRAQLGTEPQMVAGSSAGNFAVLLDTQISAVEMNDLEKDIPIYWRIGPSQFDTASDSFAQQQITFADLASKPFSPVHIKATRLPNDDLSFEWIRCSRVYGDNWEAEQVPLGETSEAYRVSVYENQTLMREFDTQFSAATYSAADQISDFSQLPNNLKISIAQLDSFSIPGTARSIELDFA